MEDIDVIELSPFQGKKVIFIDTESINPWCIRQPLTGSPFNLFNALLTVSIAENLRKNLLEKELKNRDIAILSPYRSQIKLIARLVQEKKMTELIKPATIHRYQGKESDIVLFDIPEGFPKSVTWLNGGFGSEAMRLINVAITIAKSKLIIIGNISYLLSYLDIKSILRHIVLKILNHGNIITISSLEQFIPSCQVFNYRGFYYTVKADMEEAKEEIIISYPHISEHFITQFKTALETLINRGKKYTY